MWEVKLLNELNISAPKLVTILGRLTEIEGRIESQLWGGKFRQFSVVH